MNIVSLRALVFKLICSKTQLWNCTYGRAFESMDDVSHLVYNLFTFRTTFGNAFISTFKRISYVYSFVMESSVDVLRSAFWYWRRGNAFLRIAFLVDQSIRAYSTLGMNEWTFLLSTDSAFAPFWPCRTGGQNCKIPVLHRRSIVQAFLHCVCTFTTYIHIFITM